MKKYICIRELKLVNKHYRVGDEISQSQYNNLERVQQVYCFTESSSRQDDGVIDAFIVDRFDDGLPSEQDIADEIFDADSHDDEGTFGGGDFGGSGAGDDW